MSDNKTFIPLENNPDVMTKLAHQLGVSPEVGFHDVYSLTDPDLLAFLPRPAYALLFVHPITKTSETFHESSFSDEPEYHGHGAGEAVMFYHQTIHHACGLIGLLHCTTNGPVRDMIEPNSDLQTLIRETEPLDATARAKFLYDSEMLEKAHAAAAQTGDTVAPPLGEDPGHAFIAFVKGRDNHLYELEGRNKGPIDRALLREDEDVLSENALKQGPMPFIEREQASGSGVSRFSCTVLAPTAV